MIAFALSIVAAIVSLNLLFLNWAAGYAALGVVILVIMGCCMGFSALTRCLARLFRGKSA